MKRYILYVLDSDDVIDDDDDDDDDDYILHLEVSDDDDSTSSPFIGSPITQAGNTSSDSGRV